MPPVFLILAYKHGRWLKGSQSDYERNFETLN
jgi:hypothetical protein